MDRWPRWGRGDWIALGVFLLVVLALALAAKS